MIQPDDFDANEAWIVLKLNSAPFRVHEGEFDIHVVADAGSAFIIGEVIVPSEGKAPALNEVEGIFLDGLEATSQWPQKLLLHDALVSVPTYHRAAAVHAITVEVIEEGELVKYLTDLRAAFKDFGSNGFW